MPPILSPTVRCLLHQTAESLYDTAVNLCIAGTHILEALGTICYDRSSLHSARAATLSPTLDVMEELETGVEDDD